MPDSDSSKSWWTTMPGLLTGFAAIVTAAGSLIAVLVQGGFIGQRATPPAAAAPAGPAVAPPKQAPPATDSNSATSAAANPIAPAAPATLKNVRVTGKSGSVVMLQPSAEILGASLPLADGQEVSFDRIDRVEIAQPWDGRLKIVLVGGGALDASAANLPMSGVSELGRYTAMLSDIRQIDFIRQGPP